MAGTGELHQPLGLTPKAGRRRISSRALAITIVVALSAAGYAVTYHLLSEPQPDRPAAVATITTAPAPAPVAPAPAVPGPPSSPLSSVRDAPRALATADDAGPLIINVPQALGLELPPAPDPRLVEKGRYGPLPRIGADRSKPLDVYARPVVASLPPGAPRIALVVGGMGLSDALTRQAIAALPGAVTLGFAPYGDDLPGEVAAARARGHEIVLQVPMESFDAPPGGPHVLRTGVAPEQMLDDLHWLMSRYTGYVGLAGFLGARFTADASAMTALLHDVAGRGLLYLDDGSAPRSLASSLAAGQNAPLLRADVNLDGASIDDGLLKLEAMARANGSAVGVVTGLPKTLDRLARFTQGLEARSIALVPLRSLLDVRAAAAPTVGRTP